MKAMILAAGLGTRLQPLTCVRPKPLFPVMFRPMLAHVLHQLQQQGVREVVINLHHHAAQVQQWLTRDRYGDLHVHLSHEERLLGTAGALKRVQVLLGNAPFLVINADVLIDLDLRAVLHWHRQRRVLVTLVVRAEAAAHQYGPVVVDAADRVVQISGRPPLEGPVAGQEMVFTGVQVVAPEVLDTIPPETVASTTADIYPVLVAQRGAVYAYQHQGYWLDVGVPARYLQAHWDILDGKRGKEWLDPLLAAGGLFLGHGKQQYASNGAVLRPPVALGAGVELAPGACVGPYVVLGSGCHIAAGARVWESVLWEEVQVGEKAHVQGCIVGTGARICAAQWVSGRLVIA